MVEISYSQEVSEQGSENVHLSFLDTFCHCLILYIQDEPKIQFKILLVK